MTMTDETVWRSVFTNEVIRAIGALARQQNVCREQAGQAVFVTGMEAAREYIVEHLASSPLQWTLDNIYTIARREVNRLHIPMTTERYQERWGHVLRLCEQAGCQGRGVLSDNGGPVEPLVHGQTCQKAPHDKLSGGYLHGEDDDTPYMVDHWPYCGRCHSVLDLDTWKRAPK